MKKTEGNKEMSRKRERDGERKSSGTGGIKKREGKRRERLSKGKNTERITGHIRKKCNYILF